MFLSLYITILKKKILLFISLWIYHFLLMYPKKYDMKIQEMDVIFLRLRALK